MGTLSGGNILKSVTTLSIKEIQSIQTTIVAQELKVKGAKK